MSKAVFDDKSGLWVQDYESYHNGKSYGIFKKYFIVEPEYMTEQEYIDKYQKRDIYNVIITQWLR